MSKCEACSIFNAGLKIFKRVAAAENKIPYLYLSLGGLVQDMSKMLVAEKECEGCYHRLSTFWSTSAGLPELQQLLEYEPPQQ